MLTAETSTTTENLNLFWRLKWLCHNKRYARARAIECGVSGLVVETILLKRPEEGENDSERSWGLKDLAVYLAWKSCTLSSSTFMNLHSVTFVQACKWSWLQMTPAGKWWKDWKWFAQMILPKCINCLVSMKSLRMYKFFKELTYYFEPTSEHFMLMLTLSSLNITAT